MNGSDTGRGKHGNQRFRHGRHIDEDAVALLHAIIEHDGGKRLHFFQKFVIGDLARPARNRAFTDERELVAAPIGDMAVERVVAGIALSPGVPAAIGAFAACENLLHGLNQFHCRRSIRPEAFKDRSAMRHRFRHSSKSCCSSRNTHRAALR